MENIDRKPTIYVAEDYDPLRRMIVRFLNEQYDVTDFSNGLDLLEVIRRNPGKPELLLTAHNLRGINDEDLIVEYRKIWRLEIPPREVPVILMSRTKENYRPETPAFRDRLESLDIQDILVKPFSGEYLLQRVALLL